MAFIAYVKNAEIRNRRGIPMAEIDEMLYCEKCKKMMLAKNFY